MKLLVFLSLVALCTAGALDEHKYKFFEGLKTYKVKEPSESYVKLVEPFEAKPYEPFEHKLIEVPKSKYFDSKVSLGHHSVVKPLTHHNIKLVDAHQLWAKQLNPWDTRLIHEPKIIETIGAKYPYDIKLIDEPKIEIIGAIDAKYPWDSSFIEEPKIKIIESYPTYGHQYPSHIKYVEEPKIKIIGANYPTHWESKYISEPKIKIIDTISGHKAYNPWQSKVVDDSTPKFSDNGYATKLYYVNPSQSAKFFTVPHTITTGLKGETIVLKDQKDDHKVYEVKKDHFNEQKAKFLYHKQQPIYELKKESDFLYPKKPEAYLPYGSTHFY